jgi:hypothetical protein
MLLSHFPKCPLFDTALYLNTQTDIGLCTQNYVVLPEKFYHNDSVLLQITKKNS